MIVMSAFSVLLLQTVEKVYFILHSVTCQQHHQSTVRVGGGEFLFAGKGGGGEDELRVT